MIIRTAALSFVSLSAGFVLGVVCWRDPKVESAAVDDSSQIVHGSEYIGVMSAGEELLKVESEYIDMYYAEMFLGCYSEPLFCGKGYGNKRVTKIIYGDWKEVRRGASDVLALIKSVIDKYPRQSPLLIGGIYDSCIDGNGIDHGLLIDGILDIIENKVARWGGGRKPDSVINGAPEHAMFLLHELLLHLMDRKLDIRQEDRSWNEHYERVVKLRDVSPAMSAIAGRIEKSGSVRGVIWWPKADAEGSDTDKKTK